MKRSLPANLLLIGGTKVMWPTQTSRSFRFYAMLVWVVGTLCTRLPAQEPPAVNVEYTVRRIWDEAPHNAFTDLIRFRGRFYCTFREGAGHVHNEDGSEGKIRVIVSDDARQWNPVALLAEVGIDLRDPKLSITPDGRLMLLMGGSYYRDGELQRQLSRVAFSNEQGTEWHGQRTHRAAQRRGHELPRPRRVRGQAFRFLLFKPRGEDGRLLGSDAAGELAWHYY
jgi:hypothetical protein